MSRDYDPIGQQAGNGWSFRSLAIALLIAFVGGILAAGWVISHFDLFGTEAVQSEIAENPKSEAEKLLAERIDESGRVAPKPAALPAESENSGTASLPRGLQLRVKDLEDRLSRINVQAEMAGGNVARAESLLIAFATRRALDQGRSLGYLDSQLQLRFGKARPDAVETLRDFARKPVTLESLQSELDDLGESLTSGAGDNWLGTIQQELSELFVLRREGSPSPAPSKRLERARRYTDSGNIAAAIAEIKRLPGKSRGQDWLVKAERYQAAQDALDELENAAIFEPRMLRDTSGEPVSQPSPVKAVPDQAERPE